MSARSSARGSLVLVAMAAGSTACQERSAPSSQASGAPVARPAPALQIFVDGKLTRSVALGDLATRPAVASYVVDEAPVHRWRQLEARAGQRSLVAARYEQAYAGQDAILYLDGDRPAIGMFRRVTAEASPVVRDLALTPTSTLVDVEEIRIRTIEATRPATSGRHLELVAGGKPCRLDEPTLAMIRPARAAEQRGGDGKGRQDRTGWLLRDLAQHCFQRDPVAAHAKGDEVLDLDGAAFARDDRQIVVKLNRRGESVLRVLDLSGDRTTVVAEARNPTRIDVELSPPQPSVQ